MKKIILSIGAVVLLITLLMLNPFAMIDTGERGIVTRFGALTGRIMEPGLNWRTPFVEDVERYNVQTQSVTQEGALAYTKDGQIVSMQSTLNYNIFPDKVAQLHQDIGRSYENKIIFPIMEEVVKTNIAKYSAIDIPTNRTAISDNIEKELRARLEPQFIFVGDYIFKNEDFDLIHQ